MTKSTRVGFRGACVPRQPNPTNPCIIRSSLETLNVAVVRRMRKDIISYPSCERTTRSSWNLLRWILLMRARPGTRSRRNGERREKMLNQPASRGTRGGFSFQRSCLLLVHATSEEIMRRGMWPMHLFDRVWINVCSILMHASGHRYGTDRGWRWTMMTFWGSRFWGRWTSREQC